MILGAIRSNRLIVPENPRARKVTAAALQHPQGLYRYERTVRLRAILNVLLREIRANGLQADKLQAINMYAVRH